MADVPDPRGGEPPPRLPPPYEPIPQQGGDYYDQFIALLQQIDSHVELVSRVLTQQTASLTKSFAQSFYNTGPSRGVEGRAYSSTSSSSSLTIGDEAAARRALAALANVTSPSRAAQPAAVPRPRVGHPLDRDESMAEGSDDRHLPHSSDWRKRVTHEALGSFLPIPRLAGAQLNTADLLDYMSVLSANVAYKKQSKIDAGTQGKRDAAVQAALQTGELTADEDGPNITPDFQQRLERESPASDTRLGGVSNAFAKLSDAYTQGRYVRSIINKVMAPVHNLSTLGYATGYEGSPSSFLGLRSPGAMMSGLGQRLSALGFAFGNDISPGQAQLIYNNLFNQGWMGGSATNNMRTAAAQMMQVNPYIASSPEYYSMQDEATRQGATSLATFNDVMKQIPGAAKAANVPLSQMMSDMQALGGWSKSTGGSAINGYNDATTFSAASGLPAGILGEFLKSPMVQGQVFLRSGLMPFEQGLASPYQQMQGVMNTVSMLSRMYHPKPLVEKGPDGLNYTVSSEQRREALVSSLLQKQGANVSAQTIHTLMTNAKGIQAGYAAQQAGQNYASTIQAQLRAGHNQAAFNTLEGAPWQHLEQLLGAAVDTNGHPIFTAAQRKQLAGIGKDVTQGHWVTRMGRNFGLPPHVWVPPQVSKTSMSDIARQRARLIQSFVQQHTQATGGANGAGTGPTVTVELGPAAKKVLKLSTPQGSAKLNANAGAQSINVNAYASGTPTWAPFPNLDTAGSPNAYGGQYDTGEYNGG